jgi:hypothetical protein
MAGDASAALGSQEIAGTLVNPRGSLKKRVAGVAGREVAGLVGSTAAVLATRDRAASDLPDFVRARRDSPGSYSGSPGCFALTG